MDGSKCMFRRKTYRREFVFFHIHICLFYAQSIFEKHVCFRFRALLRVILFIFFLKDDPFSLRTFLKVLPWTCYRGFQYRHGGIGKVPGMLTLPSHNQPPHGVHYDDLDLDGADIRHHPMPNLPHCMTCTKGRFLCPWECECIPEKLR